VFQKEICSVILLCKCLEESLFVFEVQNLPSWCPRPQLGEVSCPLHIVQIYKAEFHCLFKDMFVRHLILNKSFKLSHFQYSDIAGLKHSQYSVNFLTNVCNFKNFTMTFIIFK